MLKNKISDGIRLPKCKRTEVKYNPLSKYRPNVSLKRDIVLKYLIFQFNIYSSIDQNTNVNI